jgi:hypothetical protein
MSSQSEQIFLVFNFMDLECLIIWRSEYELSVIRVINWSNGRAVGLDGEGVSFSIVSPDLDCLIFWGTGNLISLGRELNISDSVLELSKYFTLWPRYL